MRYTTLLRIIDQIREEAPQKQSARYRPIASDTDKINAARSRAFIHLYFKVSFGILDFQEREKFITDGSYDGGIDGYYIDRNTKIIYIIQSKFRINQKNFEEKSIDFSELLSMDIDRILKGEDRDEVGNPYNGKIQQFQREIRELSDIGRYAYKVVIIANANNISQSNLRKLTNGYSVDVFNFERSYDDLVFPVISGTYFTAGDISIPIDLSNKNAGSKISYTVTTKISDCEITVLFVPTIEIARVMSKYKNSILKYNPRSYLDLDGKSVNSAIHNTITNIETNEFALFNNGITMLSEETYINERIGQKNKAQLIVKNPQIINGGQTSYTLSRIYDTSPEVDRELIFEGKEVLVKIITIINNSSDDEKRLLIDDISNATNKQTPVINADRYSNEKIHSDIQKKVYAKYGLLYERKRGEFSDGIHSKYIDPDMIIERNLFLRIFYSSNGQTTKGGQKKLFQKNDFPNEFLDNDEMFDRFYLGYLAYRNFTTGINPNKPIDRMIYIKLYHFVKKYFNAPDIFDSNLFNRNIDEFRSSWIDLPDGKTTRIKNRRRKNINSSNEEITSTHTEGDNATDESRTISPL